MSSVNFHVQVEPISVVDIVVCVCYVLFAILMHCGLSDSEFSKFLSFKVKIVCLDLVVCLCHALSLIPMHCGLLAGEFSKFSYI